MEQLIAELLEGIAGLDENEAAIIAYETAALEVALRTGGDDRIAEYGMLRRELLRRMSPTPPIGGPA